jgi:hypothetical protein
MRHLDKQTAEDMIANLLLQHWDPLGVKENPGPHPEYAGYAHEVFGLLARGASDVQIARHLHRAERDELQKPELVERDLTVLVGELRAFENSSL